MQHQQPTFESAYGNAPPASKGSWLARVSHRASHIPLRASHLSAATSASASAREGSRDLPLRSGSHDQTALSQLSSGGVSPTETEFAATPFDVSFGERVDSGHRHRSTPPTRAPSAPDLSILSSLAEKNRSRSGTATRASETLSREKMDKYARQAGDSTYDSDAEADDEFERSVFSSPIIAGHFADDQSDHPSDSEDDEVSLVDGGGGDTPTTQGWGDRDGRSPTGHILSWTEEEAADYVASLSPTLKQYGQRFVEEGVNGEALVALHHEELRELGVASVGHRLTILKAIYEQKRRSGIKIEEDDYVPLSAEDEKGDTTATQDDISRIIDSIRLRDERIIAAEQDLRAMKKDLDRISEENRKLREETLPVMRLMKDQRTPLPDPEGGRMPSPREPNLSRQSDPVGDQNKNSTLSRKFSTKKLFLKSEPAKQPSPTYPPPSQTPQPREIRDDGGTHLEASAAAMAASSHLTASMTSQTSPSSAHGQLSPTSPAYSTQGPVTGGSYHGPGSAASRSFPRDSNVSRHTHTDDTGTGYSSTSHWSQASTIVADQPSARLQQDRSRRQAPTPSPREDEAPGHGGGRERERDNPQVEIFKSFRVGVDDPCRVVLPVALKRYNITDDWRQYALYIVHGDQERCLGLEEKPLLLFKQLDKEGRKPMFMLRRHASPQEGWSGTTGQGIPGQNPADAVNAGSGAVAGGVGGAGGSKVISFNNSLPRSRAGPPTGSSQAQVPGGVL